MRRFVAAEKRKYGYGPAKMSVRVRSALGISVSANALYRFMKRAGLVRLRPKPPPGYAPMAEPYRASFPGDNVQLDVKYVPDRERPSSWRYQYRFVDCATNWQFACDMPRKDAAATVAAFRGAEKSFPFPILGIQTDNGSEFRGDFHAFLRKAGIPHRFIPKRSAPWNGKVERANRSVDDEFYLNPGKPWDALAGYVRRYVFERPHLGKGMGGMTPYQKWLSFGLPNQGVTPRR